MRSLICWILTLCIPGAGVFCQDTIPGNDKNASKREKIIKKGWNFGALPTIAYDSDMGFMYGALAGIYNYGDGSRYPMYDHYFFLLASKYTKGAGAGLHIAMNENFIVACDYARALDRQDGISGLYVGLDFLF